MCVKRFLMPRGGHGVSRHQATGADTIAAAGPWGDHLAAWYEARFSILYC
jgi:hypothetical protein